MAGTLGCRNVKFTKLNVSQNELQNWDDFREETEFGNWSLLNVLCDLFVVFIMVCTSLNLLPPGRQEKHKIGPAGAVSLSIKWHSDILYFVNPSLVCARQKESLEQLPLLEDDPVEDWEVLVEDEFVNLGEEPLLLLAVEHVLQTDTAAVG